MELIFYIIAGLSCSAIFIITIFMFVFLLYTMLKLVDVIFELLKIPNPVYIVVEKIIAYLRS